VYTIRNVYEDYAQYVQEWLVEHQWQSLLGQNVDSTDMAFALSVRVLILRHNTLMRIQNKLVYKPMDLGNLRKMLSLKLVDKFIQYQLDVEVMKCYG
jgi:hypothetical protein